MVDVSIFDVKTSTFDFSTILRFTIVYGYFNSYSITACGGIRSTRKFYDFRVVRFDFSSVPKGRASTELLQSVFFFFVNTYYVLYKI